MAVTTSKQAFTLCGARVSCRSVAVYGPCVTKKSIKYRKTNSENNALLTMLECFFLHAAVDRYTDHCARLNKRSEREGMTPPFSPTRITIPKSSRLPKLAELSSNAYTVTIIFISRLCIYPSVVYTSHQN